MADEPTYYAPPQDHDRHIRQMQIWLAVLFSTCALLVILFILNAHNIAVHLPFSAEKQFVRPYEALAKKWLGGGTSNSDIDAYLQQLADQLRPAVGIPDDFAIEVHYINSDTPNAFATLGGNIFVFRGLLESIPDENSLAMVMAHEMAHVLHRDPVVSIGRGVALQMIYTFITGDYGKSADLAAAGGEIGLLFFSRAQESAADNVAINALQSHYGHVGGFSTFFTQMREQISEQKDMPGWLSTHPGVDDRIDFLQQQVIEHHWQELENVALPENVRLEIAKKEK